MGLIKTKIVAAVAVLFWISWLASGYDCQYQNHQYKEYICAYYNFLNWLFTAVLEFFNKYQGAITALATLAISAFTLQLKGATVGLINATENLAKDAEKNSIITQRAFVFVKEFSITPIIPNGRVTYYQVVPMWENSGTTPSKNLFLNVHWEYREDDLPDNFDYPYPDRAQTSFLGPKAMAGSAPIRIPADDVDRVRVGMLKIFIWGRADYFDVFEGTRPHFTEFCMQLKAAPETTPQGILIAFPHFGPHNRSDQDT